MKDKYEIMKETWNDYPSQDNEGFQPERGSYKCGFFMAWDYQQKRIDEIEKELNYFRGLEMISKDLCDELENENGDAIKLLVNKVTDLHSRIIVTEKANKILREACEAIASIDKPSRKTEEYWSQKRTHKECATVLATDAKIAINALKQASEVMDE